MNTIQDYIEYWNNFINDWYLDPLAFFKSKNNYWNKFQDLIFYADALPEPYYGNPLSFSCIILNLNPYGGVNYKLQKHPDGLFLKKFKPEKHYFDFAQSFPYLNNFKDTNIGKWWLKREQWITRISASTKKPFSIQICPWHAKFSDGRGLKGYSIDYVIDFIIKPIEIIYKNGDLKIIISVGKEFEYLYEDLGFNRLEMFSVDPLIKNRYYPLGKDGNPIRRFYNVWESTSGILYLNTFTVGTNECPSSDFNQVELNILNMLRYSEKL